MSKNKLPIRLDSLLSGVLLIFSMILLSLLAYKGLGHPIDYDEAYNLQVVDSLAKGRGYASYGVLRGDGLWLFDPHITTGPAILMPLAAIWAISDGSILAIRLFMMTFLLGYVIALYYFLKRVNDKALIFAIALAAFLSAYDLQAGKVLGELPAAAVLVLAAALMTRQRYVFSALMIGIAIQIKLVFGLAGLILMSAPIFRWVLDGSPVKVKTILTMGLMAAGPSFFFEIYRYLSFQDLNLYLYSIDELKGFLRSQNINNFLGWTHPASIGEKFSGLYRLMPTYSWIAGALALSSFIILSSVGTKEPSDGLSQHQTNDSHIARLVMIFLWLAGAAMLWGWITQSNQIGARQGLPYLLLSFPVVTALCCTYCAALKRDGAASKRILSHTIIVSLAGLLMGTLVLNIKSVINIDHRSILEERAQVLRALENEKPKSLLVDGWWQNPEYQLATKIPFISHKTGDAQMLLVQKYQTSLTQSNWDVYKKQCAQVVYSSDLNLLCWLPDFRISEASIEVLDWGPQSTKAGDVPNRQPDGGAGIWIKVKKTDVEVAGPVKVYFDTFPAYLSYFHPDGEVITASIPPRLFSRAGFLQVSVQRVATGVSTHVGHFSVK